MCHKRAILAKYITTGSGPIRPWIEVFPPKQSTVEKWRLRTGAESGPDQVGDFFKIAGRRRTKFEGHGL